MSDTTTGKHTAGPWTAAQRDYGYPEVEGGPERRLWEVKAPAGYNLAGLTIYSRDEADARLIAAAPEMLEALREIADDYADRFDLTSSSTNPGIKYVIEQARAAIRKATGDAA